MNFFSGSALFFTTVFRIYGQELPPRPMIVTVNMSQVLSFGALYNAGTGGTVIIFPNGSRSSTGDVVLLSMGYSFNSALYDIVANPGTIVSVLNGPDATLYGSNGGTMTFKISGSYPSNPFIITTTPPTPSRLMIGGILIVGNQFANPNGNYRGTFNITFTQE